MRILSSSSSNREYLSSFQNILVGSAFDTMPEVEVSILTVDTIEDPRHRTIANGRANLQVLDDLLEQPDGLYAICDIDIMFLSSIEPIKDLDFDIAVTVRDMPARYNSGVWFVRLEKARPFLKSWRDELEREINNFDKEKLWILEWAGINQSSLATTIDQNSSINLVELPCLEWNATQSEWDRVTPQTKAVHLKGELRRMILGQQEPEENLFPLIKKAQEYL